MGWKIRSQYKWENMVSAQEPLDGNRLPAGVVDAGAVAVSRRNPTPVVVAPRAAPRASSVDEYTILLRAIWATLGIDAAQAYLSAAGKPAGDGVTIAFIDGHFQPNHPVLRNANIADAYDFAGPDTLPWDSSGRYDLHGTSTSGMVASSWSKLPGVAPAARFLLYRVQIDAPNDTIVEEDHLAEAIIRAADHGADVISISLGFRWVDPNNQTAMYPWRAFDGRSIPGSLVATQAAQRGIVVVVAAGNEGHMGAESIGSPADADSILTVGAVDTSGQLCGFSSWGPTFDGRIKPDVVAAGCNDPIAGPAPEFRTYAAGTSLAAPLVAGMAVLALQMAPGLRGEDLVLALRSSGTLKSAPTAKMGWGVPSLPGVKYLAPFLSKKATSPSLPSVWSPSKDPLLFFASSAQTEGHLGIELLDVQGRIKFRWEGNLPLRVAKDREGRFGNPVWNPSWQNAPRQGLLVARWWGDYGTGATTIYVAP
jgi:subtilisin family serine protease